MAQDLLTIAEERVTNCDPFNKRILEMDLNLGIRALN